jgi:hypothetical protein
MFILTSYPCSDYLLDIQFFQQSQPMASLHLILLKVLSTRFGLLASLMVFLTK